MSNSTLHKATKSTGVITTATSFCAPDAARDSRAAGADFASISPLGILANISSPPPSFERVVTRFALQSSARELLPRELVAKCLRRPIPGRSVDVCYAPARSSAHYAGLQVCASVWHCPVCAAKISERRRVELTAGLLATSQPGCVARRVLLVTFTLQHTASDALSLVLASLKAARARLVSGKAAAGFAAKYGIVGYVRSLEVTYGKNGWHPHLHVLYFFDREVPILAFEQHIKARWSAAVAALGGSASLEHGCDVKFADQDVAAYVAKWGKDPKWTAAHEVAKAVTKKGRVGGLTPLELLSDYHNGNAAAGRRWLEYAVNFQGQRQLWWSHGLRALLGLVEQEKTDDELAAEQNDIAIILASLSPGAWRLVVGNDARAELLEVAATGDRERVYSFLSLLGVKGL